MLEFIVRRSIWRNKYIIIFERTYFGMVIAYYDSGEYDELNVLHLPLGSVEFLDKGERRKCNSLRVLFLQIIILGVE